MIGVASIQALPLSFVKPILAILAHEQEEAISVEPLIERANVSCEIVLVESERRADTNANTIDVIECIFQFRGGAYEPECHEASLSDAGWVHAGIPDSDCVLSGANG
jgi:hypothetical protein